MTTPHPVLSSVRHCPGCGGADLDFASGKSVRCRSCGLELFFNPAAAAGLLLCDAAGRLLLVRRALDPGAGKLGAPGGFTDCGESSEETAVRELREETGLILSPDSLDYLCSTYNFYRFKGVEYLSQDIYFTARIPSFDAARALSETRSLAILFPADIRDDDVAFPSLRRALSVYRGKFG